MEFIPPRSPEWAVSDNNDDDDDGSAVLIDFAPDAALHEIMQLPIAAGQGATAVFPPAVPNNPGRDFWKWMEDVALSSGLTVGNQVVTFDGVKREGLWHQVPGHVADNFEARLQNYNWNVTL